MLIEKSLMDAIEIMENEKPSCGEKIVYTEGERSEAYCAAIEALEKQLPKKVKQSGVTSSDGKFHPINGINGVPYDLCPNCDTNLCTDGVLGRRKEYMKHCENCGQRLDWSE